jgi:hypothetical protein
MVHELGTTPLSEGWKYARKRRPKQYSLMQNERRALPQTPKAIHMNDLRFDIAIQNCPGSFR